MSVISSEFLPRANFCTKASWYLRSSWDKVSQIAQSALGKVAISIGAELVGATLGKMIGEGIAHRVTKPLLGDDSTIASLCELVSGVSVAIGFGYVGLRASQCSIELDSYAVASTRYEMARLSFDAIVAAPQSLIPWICLSPVRFLAATLCKTVAYHADKVGELASEIIHKRRQPGKALFDKIISQVCKNYCITKVGELKDAVTKHAQGYMDPPPLLSIFLSFVFPQFKAGLGGIWAISLASKVPAVEKRIRPIVEILREQLELDKKISEHEEKINSAIDNLSSRATFYTTVIICSLHEFIKKIEKSEKIHKALSNHRNSSVINEAEHQKSLKKALHEELGISWVLSIADQLFTKPFEDIVSPWISEIQKKEVEWVGTNLLSKKTISEYQKQAPIFIQTFLLYTLENISSFRTPLTPLQQHNFFQDINYLFFKIYVEKITGIRISEGLKGISQSLFTSLYKTERFLSPSDQMSGVYGTAINKEDYFPVILRDEKCDFEEDMVQLTNPEALLEQYFYDKSPPPQSSSLPVASVANPPPPLLEEVKEDGQHEIKEFKSSQGEVMFGANSQSDDEFEKIEESDGVTSISNVPKGPTILNATVDFVNNYLPKNWHPSLPYSFNRMSNPSHLDFNNGMNLKLAASINHGKSKKKGGLKPIN